MVDTSPPSDSQSGLPVSTDEDESVARVEAYDTDDGVVLYDSENPLAWIQTRETVRVDDMT